ncbi:hypothetical protein OH491_13355 [Termitidicoccus mucosus]|uniref:DUF4595 domain-containing protein n=1 Tax=Termitidicoccus mucosus TaxID=1184151 RepID=A0A178IGV4_9BACT|nr:hypothetical protein AW736_14090 [Opitutaceae bacterium TSB47]
MNTKHTTCLLLTTIAAIAALSLAGCGKSGSSGPSASGSSSAREGALSIKYKKDNTVYIFTKSADGQKKRMDSISSHDGHQHQETQIWDRNGGPNKKGIVHKYEDGAWKELLRTDASGNLDMAALRVEQNLNNAFSDPVADLTKYYVHEKVGFTKQPSVTIAGKTCDVYAGVRPENTGGLPRYGDLNFGKSYEEIAVWNGITMRLKYTRTLSNGAKEETVCLEALAVTQKVPDSAFTKTLETTWIK